MQNAWRHPACTLLDFETSPPVSTRPRSGETVASAWIPQQPVSTAPTRTRRRPTWRGRGGREGRGGCGWRPLRLPEDSVQLVGEFAYGVGSGSVLKHPFLDLLLPVHDVALSKEHEVTVYPALYPLHHTVALGLPDRLSEIGRSRLLA